MADNPLYAVPGLGGYLAAKDGNQRSDLQTLQKASAVSSLEQLLRQRGEQDAFRKEVAALGAEPDSEALIKVASKYSDPRSLLEIHQRAAERKQAASDRALQFAQTLDLRQQELDRRKSEFEQRTADAAQRQQFEQWYKTESLKNQQNMAGLNAQLRAMGLEVMKQGQQLQIQRFDAAERDRRDRAVTGFANELQHNKIPALSASISTANDLLKQYADKDIPGFGLVTGSGKVPNALRSEEANKVRSSVQAVSNDLLNLYSGLAVTLPEAERRELEEMRGGTFTSQDFKTAWPRIVNRYNTVVGNLRAGANADVLREYQSRPGAMRLDPLAPAFGAATGGPVKITTDAEFEKLPSGSVFIGPDGKTRRKP